MNVNYTQDLKKNYWPKHQTKRPSAICCYHRVYNRKTPEFRNKSKT
ncbi:hypothetical protein Halhy_4915 [Haliscomenobacter hydrossis DSM 1100]|uniref:Uncharacterized protein n=1 Tax=Haliscomenobacter hydrossis (strain ATCC 27775 / DSM 1100 / LMG 10767 / O) TaxID=760192 RepID=F4L035_HALH1|nr:hypothetical protein Halhy_4915 [Haliscomenobacter hydrossis DSM 1100]